jgi:ubiquinone/menaquinone biosynthesis C-methylase UbiE
MKEKIGDRYSILAGDALEVELGNHYDLVLIPNFLHHLDLGTIEQFLSKVFGALKPGGRVAILEFIPNEDRTAPASALTFAVMMLAITPSGDAYTFSEYNQILRRIGFSKIELHELPPTYFRLVIAQK